MKKNELWRLGIRIDAALDALHFEEMALNPEFNLLNVRGLCSRGFGAGRR